jgi:hypothetical protein
MKSTLLLAASLLGTGVALSESYGAPYYSVGSLDADQSTISNVAGPDLAWKIEHPETIADIVRYDAASGSLVTLVELRVRAHIVGIGKRSTVSPYRTGFWTQIGAGAWDLKFDGTPLTQRAAESVLDRVLPANTPIALAGQSHDGTRWLSQSTSTAAGGTVLGFVNGDSVPATVANAPENFLSSYLVTSAGVTEVAIGPKEMLFLFEFSDNGTTQDHQDLAVLFSFDAL